MARKGDPGASFGHEITIFSEKRCLVLGTTECEDYVDWVKALTETIKEHNEKYALCKTKPLWLV